MAWYQWLLWGLLCEMLLQVAHSEDVRIEFLVAVKQGENGVELSAIPKTFETASIFETKLVPGQQLSSDCGDQWFRCKLLPVLTQNTSNVTVYQLFVPLDMGLLVMELKLSVDTSKRVLNFGYQQIVEARTDCSPTAIFKIYDSYYTMCTNLQNKVISLYEIRVNKTSISHTEMIGPLLSVDDFASSDVVNMSNFLVSTDSPHQPLIYFSIDNYLFAIDPLDYLIFLEFTQIGTARCRYIRQLAHASNSQLLAYCSSEYVYFDTEQQHWVSEHSYAGSGVPYLCPNDLYKVKAFKNYLEYSIGQNQGTVSNVNVDSGVCFTSVDGQSFFVYTDRIADTTTLMDLTSSRVGEPLCNNQDCLPVITIEDPVRYLVVGKPSHDGQVSVLDISTNFSTIVSVDHKISDMYTIVHAKGQLYPSAPSPLSVGQRSALIVGLIIGALVVVALISVGVVVTMILGCSNKQRSVCRIREEALIPVSVSGSAVVLTNHYEVDSHQVHPETEQRPVSESQSGNRANSMQAGGVTNGNLQSIFGEEEKTLYKEKQLEEKESLTNKHVPVTDNTKHPLHFGPESTLLDSSSVATTPTDAVKTARISFSMATSAGEGFSRSDDSGSEDTRMNSVEQPLLES